MIKTVIFDIDNTLYSFDCAHQIAFEALTEYTEKALLIPAKRFPMLVKQANEQLKRHTGGNCAAIHNRLIRFQILLEEQGLSLSYAPKMEQVYWNTLLEAAQPEPEAVMCIQALRAQGIRIGIGTDMTADWQYRKLEKLGLLDKIDFMVSSEEASAEKPSQAFFNLCAEKARCERKACLFVGDNWKKDVQGAVLAGMNAVWYCPNRECHEIETEQRIACFSELLDRVKELN